MSTTAHLCAQALASIHGRSGYFGTLGYGALDALESGPNTTPDPVTFQRVLAALAEDGCAHVALEASSHALDQHRVEAVRFRVAAFTNLTRDHLDYHGAMDAYFRAKADWFHALAADPHSKKPVAVINADDSFGAELADELDGKMPLIRFGFGVHCDFRANNFMQSARGMEFELSTKGKSYLVRAPLIGRFNAYNLLAALAASHACGIRSREAVAALAHAPQVPGRMENVGNAGGATVFVDYAHTPDALENACRTLKELNPRRLITVFGCGGDRDRGKRPLMAAAAARHSDACVLTSDNPRSEDPLAILREIEAGIGGKNHCIIADRAEAISFAVQNSLSGDIILIAGKGHETSQQFSDHAIEFDDRKHASKALRDRAQAISTNR